MGNCICSNFTFCPPCLEGAEPVVPASIEDAPHLSKDHSPHSSLPMQLDRMLEQGGVYYLPPPPVEPCSPPVAQRLRSGEKGQSVKILVSKQQLELLVQSAKKGQFNERVMEFMMELGATNEDMFRTWRPDLPTIPE